MFRLFFLSKLLIASAIFLFNLSTYAQNPLDSIKMGKASFYADKFVKKRTASGEIYQHENFTAAHKNLPFGTWIKVVNIENNRSVIVRVNDRGPFVKGRVIDLSKAAANEIGNTNQGIYSVSVEVYQKDLDMIQATSILTPLPCPKFRLLFE